MSTILFPTILCATDGLERSDLALRKGAAIASATGADLHVVHVRQAPITAADVVMGDAAGRIAARGERIDMQIKHLEAEFELDVTRHVLDATRSRTASRIATLAAELKADLIVVGTNGRDSVGHVLRGSVSYKLPHMCGRPVLVIPGNAVKHTAPACETGQRSLSPSLSLRRR